MDWKPEQDGYTHINIYSKGKTVLGCFLTNFSFSPIITNDGNFQYIEGYWYWLSTHDERLRTLVGWDAKKRGRALDRHFEFTDIEFQQKIREACWIKIHSNQAMFNLFKESTIPFTHYYVFHNGFAKTVGFEWQVEMWEQFRVYIRNGYQ